MAFGSTDCIFSKCSVRNCELVNPNREPHDVVLVNCADKLAERDHALVRGLVAVLAGRLVSGRSHARLCRPHRPILGDLPWHGPRPLRRDIGGCTRNSDAAPRDPVRADTQPHRADRRPLLGDPDLRRAAPPPATTALPRVSRCADARTRTHDGAGGGHGLSRLAAGRPHRAAPRLAGDHETDHHPDGSRRVRAWQ